MIIRWSQIQFNGKADKTHQTLGLPPPVFKEWIFIPLTTKNQEKRKSWLFPHRANKWQLPPTGYIADLGNRNLEWKLSW